MDKPMIFVSCGQRTEEEKQLGLAICQVIKGTGNLETFFAEDQHDLNGLHENIMSALAKSVGFVAVMHPRGDVVIPATGKKLLSRASVWIEQEIAIAAFINRTSKTALKTAVYRHVSVGLEGMRELLHLNPREFSEGEEILLHLKKVLPTWSFDESKDQTGELSLSSRRSYAAHIGGIYELKPRFRNEGSRAERWSCSLDVPDLLIRPWRGTSYAMSVPPRKPGYMSMIMTEKNRNGEPILHGQTYDFMSIESSVTDLNKEERQALLNQPILLSADIGGRLYKTSIPVTDVFGFEAFGLAQ